LNVHSQAAIKRKLFSLTQLEDVLNGNKHVLNKTIKLFIEHTHPLVAQLRSNFQQKNYEEVKAIAHSIKPSMDYFSIESIAKDLETVEFLPMKK